MRAGKQLQKKPPPIREQNELSPSRPRTIDLSSSSATTSSSSYPNDDGSYDAMAYSTMRRLLNEDVRAIFECLHNQLPKPPHLDFSIVYVGPDGQKLSPPPYEFEVGLYVLLRADKKPKQKHQNYIQPKAPPHLEHLVLHNHPRATCPWQLSGPQFPTPTVIQQRYCYPKGNPEYSSRIGGALWTMFKNDGKEDEEFRILHVYYSAKRAVNKGLSLPATLSESPSSTKKPRTKRTPDRRVDNSPAVTTSSMSQTSTSCSSPPREYEGVVHPSPAHHYPYHHMYNPYPPHHNHPQNYGHFYHHRYVHQIDQVGPVNHTSSSQEVFRRYHPSVQPRTSQEKKQKHRVATSVPNRRREPPSIPRMHPAPSEDSIGPLQSPPAIRKTTVKSHDSSDSKSSLSAMDTFDLDSGSLRDIDSYWNDPLLSIMLKPSHEKIASSPTPTLNPKTPDRTLLARLETLQLSIRELILQAPNQDDQEELLSMVTTWANELARDPLGDPTLNRQHSGETEGSSTIDSSTGHKKHL
ncbi:hypothetical protein ACA910_001734 [Epithemia clementina (nom. ined.)]